MPVTGYINQGKGNHMFRLVFALVVATLLLPAEYLTSAKTEAPVLRVTSAQQEVENEEQGQVSTYDAFSAVQSLFSDITSFCDRNESTCKTGQAIASSAATSIKEGVQKLADKDEPSQDKKENPLPDPVSTGTIEK